MKVTLTPYRWLLSFLLVALPLVSSATIHNVTIGNNFFAPLGTNVNPGDTVRWTWVGGLPHSTTSDVTSPKSWDSGVSSAAGFTFDVVFTSSDPFGPFPYHCSIHAATMKDTIWLVKTPINAMVNPATGLGTDEMNASVALNDLVPGEMYSIYQHFPTPGTPFPVGLWWSFSPAGGAPGSWVDAPKPPAPGYTDEFNPWISSIPAGGYVLSSAHAAGGMWVGGANAASMNVSPGGGAPFGADVIIAPSGPGIGGTWFDYTVVEVDDDPASGNLGNAHIFWTEYIDATGGDADGNGNLYDDAGDLWTVWSASTDFGGLAGPPFPGTTAPGPITPAMPVFPNSPATHRAATDIVGAVGTPALAPGGVYVAYIDALAGVIFIDGNPAPALGAPWGALTGGFGPIAAAPIAPVPPVMAPGIQMPNGVTVAVDNSPVSPCPGAVYLAWTDMSFGDVDILFSSSFDGGLTWSPPLRVNGDPVSNGLDQWAPHMRIDESTGEIIITYYDRRNDPGNVLVEVWSSTSADCGVTWIDCMVSGAGPVPPVTLTPYPVAPFVGDYLSTDWNKLNSWGATWNDGRNGGDQDITFGRARGCDSDGDGIIDWIDNCPFMPNPGQADGDGDGWGAVCDCDDGNNSIYPGAPEIPDDGIDQDCDGFDDVTCWTDADNDGYGDPASSPTIHVGSCPTGFSNNPTDCDDTNPGINPGATEIPDNGIDEDCDGFDDVTCWTDADNDGYGDPASSPTIHTGSCPAGFSNLPTDCDDTNPGINPGATEIPDNGIDEDCNGFDASTCYADTDSDTYGDATNSVIDPDGICDAGFVSDNTDCDDGDSGINPGATEIPDDGIDQDCDTFDDITCWADTDSDGFGDPASPLVHTGSCGSGYVDNDLDCDDTDPGVGDCSSCCGTFTGGFTGNTDCDAAGKRNLADITRLIDYVYISKTALCCTENGNVDGDALAKINLADITRLIDHVYISKAQTAACP